MCTEQVAYSAGSKVHSLYLFSEVIASRIISLAIVVVQQISFYSPHPRLVDTPDDLPAVHTSEAQTLDVQMVDVGCGIGGSSRYLIQKHVQASARGITLSPVQAQRANALAEQLGLATRTSFQANRLGVFKLFLLSTHVQTCLECCVFM